MPEEWDEIQSAEEQVETEIWSVLIRYVLESDIEPGEIIIVLDNVRAGVVECMIED